MNKLTLPFLKKIKPDVVFASGIIENSPKGLFMNRQGGMIRWVAVKGDGDDWAIYWGRDYQADDYIKEWGNKISVKEDIRKLILATEEVYSLYRI